MGARAAVDEEVRRHSSRRPRDVVIDVRHGPREIGAGAGAHQEERRTAEEPIELLERATALQESRPGYWTTAAPEDVSYPRGGHAFNHGLQSDSFWYRHRTACILAAIDRNPPAGHILDVGGGTGQLTEALTAHGHPTVLVEPTPEGAQIAWERGLRPVVQATTTMAGLPGGSIPAIGAFDVVEHIEDDAAFLWHLHELLVPGGMLYLTVPAHQWLWSVDDVRACHHRRYERRTMAELLGRTGFRVVYLTQFFRPLTLPILLVRSIPSRLGRRDATDMTAVARNHRPPNQLVGRVVDRVLRPEIRAIAAGRSMRVGSSILAVASRV